MSDLVRREDALAVVDFWQGDWSYTVSALRALPAVQPDAGWQPIKTATKDVGNCLFFGNTRHDVRLVFSGWVATNGMFYSDNGELCRPTHWMPHPAPPFTKGAA